MIEYPVRVTILMSIYNEAQEWIMESVSSMLNQTFSDFEFIIIDDNPDSLTNKELLNVLIKQDSRILVFHNKTNIGLTKSLNFGISQSKGKYIVRMDADDVSDLNRIEKQYNFMEDNPSCVVCGSYYLPITQNAKVAKFPTGNLELKNHLLLDNGIPHPSAIIRRSVLVANMVSYNEDYKYSQDYGFWCDLAEFGELRNIDEPLLNYRISGSQISTSKRSEQKKFVKEIREKYTDNLLKACGIDKKKDYYSQIEGCGGDYTLGLKKAYYVNLPGSWKFKVLKIILNRDLDLLNIYFIKILRRNSEY